MNRSLACVMLGLAACRAPAPPAPSSAPTGTEQRLEADVRFLASDTLEGRGTPSRGLDVAAEYLTARLRAAGIAPSAGDSYQQWYKVAEYRPGDARVTVAIDGRRLQPADYVFINIDRDPAPGPIDLELAYAGTGVVAEERNINELAGLDLEGKAARP